MFQRRGFLFNGTRSKISMIFLIIVMLTLALPGISVPISSYLNHHHGNLTGGGTDCTALFDFAELTERHRHCRECEELFREPELATLCRVDCFRTSYYKGCLDVISIPPTNFQPVGSPLAKLWNNYFTNKFYDIIDYLKNLPKSSQS